MTHEPHDKLQSDADTPGDSRLVEITEGPWAGWRHWEPVDDFEEHSGPFYCKPDGDGMLCGFMPDAKNRNGGGNIHGGALMTFADYVLFMTAFGADPELHGVTLTMNSEFIGAAEPGKAVAKHAPLVILEAMKMEHVLVAPAAGVIDEIRVAAGDQVAEGTVLVTFAARA